MNRSSFKLFLFALSVVMISVSCKREVVDPSSFDFGYSYYPIAHNSHWVYQVDSVTYSTQGKVSSTFYLKEQIVDSTDDFGKRVYYLYRYKRALITDTWQFDSLWYLKKDERSIIRTENNIPTVFLSFPVKANASWNVNSYNSKSESTAQYDQVGGEYTVLGTKYFNTVKIQKPKSSSFISRKNREEIVANNVGLVRVLDENLAFQPGFDTTGYIFKQQLIEYVK